MHWPAAKLSAQEWSALQIYHCLTAMLGVKWTAGIKGVIVREGYFVTYDTVMLSQQLA
jgi:hypothetical protein